MYIYMYLYQMGKKPDSEINSSGDISATRWPKPSNSVNCYLQHFSIFLLKIAQIRDLSKTLLAFLSSILT